MSDLGNAMASAIVGMLIIAVLIGAAVTAALIYGLPWIWELLKPWLHAITA